MGVFVEVLMLTDVAVAFSTRYKLQTALMLVGIG